MSVDVEFLQELTRAPGPTGFEGPVRDVVRRRLAAVATPESDPLGNVWARVVGAGGLEVVAVAHADQIGLIVTYVDDAGFVWFDRIGGVDRQVLPGHTVTIHAAPGPVEGVVGRRPSHFIPADERGKAPEFHEQYIDIGARSRAAALERIAVGDPVTFHQRFVELSADTYATLACDDRAGVYVVSRALEDYAPSTARSSLTALATVHEETTFMGARSRSLRTRPDVVVVVDGDFATDQPDVDVKKAGGEVRLGGGPVLMRGTGSNERLFQRACEAARRRDLPFQVKAAGGRMSTDADELMAAGCVTLSLGIPMRYMHAPFEVLRGDDLEAAVTLIVGLVHDLDDADDRTFCR